MRSERSLSSSAKNIDIRQKLYEKIVLKKMSSKIEFVMSTVTDQFVDNSNVQLMSSLASSLNFKRLGKMINTSIKSTLTDKRLPQTPDDIISTRHNVN